MSSKIYSRHPIPSMGYEKLKEFLIEGISINEKRLDQKNKEIEVLHESISILRRAIEEKAAMLLY